MKVSELAQVSGGWKQFVVVGPPNFELSDECWRIGVTSISESYFVFGYQIEICVSALLVK